MSFSILVTHRLPSAALAILRETGADVLLPDSPPDASTLLSLVPGHAAIVALLTDRVTTDVLDAAGKGLKVVANVAVGYDNVDVAAAAARGVIVTNTPGVLTEATAEFTWALIFAITRRVGEGDRLVRSGRWVGWSPDLLPGMELNGKQLGIVGGGRIGRSVAAKAGAFGMKVVFATRSGGPTIDGHPVISLDELLVSSDIVSLHVPLSDASRHLLDRKAFARMRRSAYLINTARGPVVDEAALVWALQEKLISGAALDVYEREPQVTEGLRALDNVVLAPHIGSATRETRQAMAELAARNVAAVLAGEPPLTPVTPPAGGRR
jgi:glyoxylate reductase